MNTLSGYIELNFGVLSEPVPFKFGTNAYALFCEKRKIEFHQIPETGVFGSNIVALRELYYCAHVSAMRSAGKEPLNIERLTDLLDEYGDKGLVDAMLQSRILGFTLKELAQGGGEEKK